MGCGTLAGRAIAAGPLDKKVARDGLHVVRKPAAVAYIPITRLTHTHTHSLLSRHLTHARTYVPLHVNISALYYNPDVKAPS